MVLGWQFLFCPLYRGFPVGQFSVATPFEGYKMNIESIAQLCHEVNRAYCECLGDMSQVSWEKAPPWQKKSAVSGVEFHIANSNAEPNDFHDSWLEEKKADGWKYGPIKDAKKKEHPCFVPYEELPVEQKAKDHIFCAIVTTAYKLYG